MRAIVEFAEYRKFSFLFIVFLYRNKSIEDVLTASRAPSTGMKYNRSISKWKVWCSDHKVCALPADHHDLGDYYMALFNAGAPYSRIETAQYAIKWFHDCSPCTEANPCDSSFIKQVLAGLRRITAKPISKKDPVTPEILSRIVNIYGFSDNLMNIRLCTMTLIAYAGFFRHSELVNLRICDVFLSSSHVKFFIHQSKTDQYREGAWVVIAATGRSTCPVAMLNRYLVLACISPHSHSEDFLFRPVVFKSINNYVLRQGRMSYSSCRDLFKRALVEIGEDPSRFGMHSLRAGGASEAARVGIPDRLFKKHGRWASDSAKDGYVKESLTNQLTVSMSLGI